MANELVSLQFSHAFLQDAVGVEPLSSAWLSFGTRRTLFSAIIA